MPLGTGELNRLEQARVNDVPWRKWGPYLSERQWGTVREDYSPNGAAWDSFSHDQARSRAYRWGEDGLAGISDDRQTLCFALGLWNEKDPILKERLFGLTNSEGNHGEDVKEYYFYLDNTPTHAWMKYLYKYPQAAYPYCNIVETNRCRGRHEFEYELLDTGIFNEDRYFDIFVEYAKDSPEDILICITAVNRGPEAAPLHILPTLWFRNTWSWGGDNRKPELVLNATSKGEPIIVANHAELGRRFLYCEGTPQVLFTNNETNVARIFGKRTQDKYFKDGIVRFLVNHERDAVNPSQTGTKASAHYSVVIEPQEQATIRLRLTDVEPDVSTRVFPAGDPFGEDFDSMLSARKSEADDFYRDVLPAKLNQDERHIARQALAGMLWSKQYYEYDIRTWLSEHGVTLSQPKPGVRNQEWIHMSNADIISMPDKWEYPWYAAWDLALHTIPLSIVDPEFAKAQLELMLRYRYLHPSGQMPAYEWNFSDVNPPVHAWTCMFNHRFRKELMGSTDYHFLLSAYPKLMMNFTWWVNRKDQSGSNVFAGGFLGLDNIGVFDRSAPLPGGGTLEQADGTAWMALYAQNMFEIALELAGVDPSYEDSACKFFEHFLWIASAMNRSYVLSEGMWDENDGFYYDILRAPDGQTTRLKVRSIVGLLPICASTTIEPEAMRRLPNFIKRADWFAKHNPDVVAATHRPGRPGHNDRHLLAMLNEDRLRRILARMLDPNEFFSDYGIRSVSKYHKDHPYVFHTNGQDFRVDYEPAESTTAAFGGNSNWRGPVWMPINIIMIRALLQLYRYYADTFTIECPTGSGQQMTLFEVAMELAKRLSRIFQAGKDGRRAVFGDTQKFQEDPHWRDHILFYEYFHGDNGAGIGASHQTGWTGCIASVLYVLASLDAKTFLQGGFIPIAVPHAGATVSVSNSATGH
jgi:hypothetical protein